MISIVSSVSDINALQWNELVATSPTSSFFQTRECYDFYASLSFLKPFIFAVTESDKLVGLICGYVISNGNVLKQFFSRRAIVPGGLLLDAQISDTALQNLLEHTARELSRKAIYLEVRNYNDYASYRASFESAGFSYKEHLNFHVATHDVDSALMQLNKTKRRYVKLSQKEGAESSESIDSEEIKAFYIILEQLYKTKIKTPLFPCEFFEKLVELSHGKIFVVKYEGKIIGGSVCVFLPNQIVYEWFVCGLDGQIKNIFPSTLATWAGIEYAAKNGYHHFDMMGAGKPDEGYGVRVFKSEFGGELVEHGRFLFICQPMLYSLGKYIVIKIKSK